MKVNWIWVLFVVLALVLLVVLFLLATMGMSWLIMKVLELFGIVWVGG